MWHTSFSSIIIIIGKFYKQKPVPVKESNRQSRAKVKFRVTWSCLLAETEDSGREPIWHTLLLQNFCFMYQW